MAGPWADRRAQVVGGLTVWQDLCQLPEFCILLHGFFLIYGWFFAFLPAM